MALTATGLRDAILAAWVEPAEEDSPEARTAARTALAMAIATGVINHIASAKIGFSLSAPNGPVTGTVG